jgi:hypothetical protein
VTYTLCVIGGIVLLTCVGAISNEIRYLRRDLRDWLWRTKDGGGL